MEWMKKRKNGLLEAKKAQTPDYSIDRFVKMASDLGNNVNSMVGHAEEEEKKLDDKAKKAKSKPEPKEKTASKKPEPTKSASVKSEPTKPASRPAPKKPEPLSPPDFIKNEEDKKRKKAKEAAMEELKRIAKERAKAKIKAKK